MPLYDYICDNCYLEGTTTRRVRIEDRDAQWCEICGHKMFRQLSAPRFRVKSLEYKPSMADRATADLLGLHGVSELDPGLRTPGKGRSDD